MISDLCGYCTQICPLLDIETKCLHEPQFSDILYEVDYVLQGKYGNIQATTLHTEIIEKFTEFALEHLLQPNFCDEKLALYALSETNKRISNLECLESLEYNLLNVTKNILLGRLRGEKYVASTEVEA